MHKKYEFRFRVSGKPPVIGYEKQVAEFLTYKEKIKKNPKEKNELKDQLLECIEEGWVMEYGSFEGVSLVKESVRRIEEKNKKRIITDSEKTIEELENQRDEFLGKYFKENVDKDKEVWIASRNHPSFDSGMRSCRGNKHLEDIHKKNAYNLTRKNFAEENGILDDFYEEIGVIATKELKKKSLAMIEKE